MRKEAKSSMNKKWIVWTLAALVIALVLYASVTVYIDPLFHYHAPLPQYQYPIEDERYQNDGILRHFEYDGIITGTSLSERFKTSVADKLFNANFGKGGLAGSCFWEQHERLERAFKSNDKIKYVIRTLDADNLFTAKDENPYGDLPEYLYNDNIFDDVNYVLNKEIFARSLRVIDYTKMGKKTTTFDNAIVEMSQRKYTGAEAVLACYTLGEPATEESHITEQEKQKLLDNLHQNVTDLIEENPNTEFYLFFPPYSICFWDTQYNLGMVSKIEEAQAAVIEELLQYKNVKLFGFDWDFGTVCDLDNYFDLIHFSTEVSEQLLRYMADGEYLITKENYHEYLADVSNFYHYYNYAALHTEQKNEQGD